VFTPENRAPHATPNHAGLYDLAPIDRQFDRSEPRVNAGVSGWRKGRDGPVLAAYAHLVERASIDSNLRALISWHDQGCLIWAIQKTGMETRVVEGFDWNLCVVNTPLETGAFPYGRDFLDRVAAVVPRASIVHWNGCSPPWHGAPSEALLSRYLREAAASE